MNLRPTLLLCVFVAVGLAIERPPTLLAQDASTAAPENNDQMLDEINRKVEEQNSELRKISTVQKQTSVEVVSLETQIKELKDREAELQAQLKDLATARKEMEADVLKIGQRVQDLRQLSLRRLRSLYLSSMQGGVMLVKALQTTQSLSITQSAWYYSKVKKFDQEMLGHLAQLRHEKGLKVVELEKVVKEQDKVLKTISEQRKGADARYAQRANLLKDLTDQKQKSELALASLRAQALRLETVVASITGADDSTGRIKPNSANKSDKKESAPSIGFEGQGFSAIKKSLPRPVDGQVVQSFGKRSTKEFADFVMSKGLEFKVAPGTKVQAVAPGKVLHVGRMPGYGSIVIVDHGKRYYSLYGRLAAVLVKVGQVLAASETIAHAEGGDAGAPIEGGASKHGNFYFEIRKDGEPMDPEQFLKAR